MLDRSYQTEFEFSFTQDGWKLLMSGEVGLSNTHLFAVVYTERPVESSSIGLDASQISASIARRKEARLKTLAKIALKDIRLSSSKWR